MSDGNPVINQLDPYVTRLLKSQVTITNLTDAVRELYQNSIDAGATNIDIEIDLKTFKITIKDDGQGISPDELNQVASRHFTSKMKSLNDLKTLNTFGFRGEALNSIASVANILIISKTEGYNFTFESAYSYSKNLYKARALNDSSEYFNCLRTKSGTCVQVSNMFLRLPVRYQQLQKIPDVNVIENIRQIVLHGLVSRSGINVTLHRITDHKRSLICKYLDDKSHTNEDQRLVKIMNSIYGISLDSYHQSLKVSYKNYHIKSFIGTLPTQTRSYQHMFYNLRALSNKSLSKSINGMFLDSNFGEQEQILTSSISNKMESPTRGKSPIKSASIVGNPYKKYPIFIILINGPSNPLDIMTDPTKIIENSSHLKILEPLIMKLIKSFLKSNNFHVKNGLKRLNLFQENEMENDSITVTDKLLTKSRLLLGRRHTDEVLGMVRSGDNDSSANSKALLNPKIVKDIVKRRKPQTHVDYHSCDDDSSNDARSTINQEITILKKTFESCQIISQVDGKFILLKARDNKTSDQTLYVIDQHACDERIKVEQLFREFIENAKNPFHDIDVSLGENSFKIEVSDFEKDLFETYQKNCNFWGIKYILSKNNSLTITHLPKIMLEKMDENRLFLKQCLLQYVFDMNDGVKLKTISSDWWLCLQALPTVIIDLINSKACRSSIMFGTKLTVNECEILVRGLSNCENPFICAHGRPSIIPICDLSKLIWEDKI